MRLQSKTLGECVSQEKLSTIFIGRKKNNFRKPFIFTGSSKTASFTSEFNKLILYFSPTINAYGKYKNKMMLEPSIKSYHCCRSVYQKTAQMTCKVRYGKSKVVPSYYKQMKILYNLENIYIDKIYLRNFFSK